MKSGKNLMSLSDLALEGIAQRGGKQYILGLWRKWSSNPDVIKRVATESPNDSQAAA